MNRYSRMLLNKIDNLTATLISDWASGCKYLSKAERKAMEEECKALEEKFAKTYRK